MYTSWQAPLGKGKKSEEMALALDQGRENRLLVLPPLFEEHNKLRYQMVEVMRRLDRTGVDCVLPDLPGCNESLAPLQDQSLTSWRKAVGAAVKHFSPTHVLAIRGGALIAPDGPNLYVYAPAKGAQILRAMVRARILASKEAGKEERLDMILAEGRKSGIELAGWHIGPKMLADLEQAVLAMGKHVRLIDQVEIGGSPLWLRAEPDDDPEQADALAALLAVGILNT